MRQNNFRKIIFSIILTYKQDLKLVKGNKKESKPHKRVGPKIENTPNEQLLESLGQGQLTVKGSSNRMLPRFQEPILG